MTAKRFILTLSLLVSGLMFACSSADDSTTGEPGPGPGDERRSAIGKADSLSGKCLDEGQSYCGGKSKGKCWCDAACAQFGDCCADLATSCGGGPGKCESNADCKAGQYCKAEGCNAPGTCTKVPTNVACTAVITPYCGCDGKTRYSNSGCIFDRYEHTGACKQETCGGIASLPCPDGKICVEDPNDNCDPNNGGADCPGQCIPDPGCPPVMCELYCANGFKKDDKGCEICSCNEPTPTNTCKGQCGGPSADKSCYCDTQCKQYNDCCSDYAEECTSTRTPASGQCVKNSNEACTTDADCTAGGCGGELCHNPALGGGISTCECAGPGAPVTGCGCVAGKCTWYN